jgi:hypothetical protein
MLAYNSIIEFFMVYTVTRIIGNRIQKVLTGFGSKIELSDTSERLVLPS